MNAEINSHQKREGDLFGFSDERDAASGARGDWHRNPAGDDGDAGIVI